MAEGDGLGEIERSLLDKLQAGIDRKVPYSNKFMKRKILLENQLKSTKDEKKKDKIREKLYLLNNLMKQSNSFLDYFSWHLLSSLYRIKKDIQSDPKSDAASAETGDQQAPRRTTGTMATKRLFGRRADMLVVLNLVRYRSGGRCEDFNVVGIFGAEGVGKTTLVKRIFDKQEEEEVKERFLPRIWISLSEHANDKKENIKIAIAKRILVALGVADEIIDGIVQCAAKDAESRPNTTITAASASDQAAQPSTSTQPLRKTLSKLTSYLPGSSPRAKDQPAIDEGKSAEDKAVEDSKRAILAELIYAIRQELMWKRYLIVLDDASETEEWYMDLSLELKPDRKPEEKLGYAFPKGSGGTVLVAGRAEEVVKGMVGGDGSDIHRLLPLEKPELCWNIYKKATEEEEEDDEEEEEGKQMDTADDKEKEVKEEVVKRSNGLPYAATLMGDISKKKMQKQSPQTALTEGNANNLQVQVDNSISEEANKGSNGS